MPDLVIYPWNVEPLVVSGAFLILVVYLAAIPGKSAAFRCLLAVLVTYVLGGISASLSNVSTNSGWDHWFFEKDVLGRFLEVVGPFMDLLLVLFAYLLGPQRMRREQRWVIGLGMVAATAIAVRTLVMEPGVDDPVNRISFSVMGIVGATVLLRKWKRAPVVAGPGEVVRSSYAAFAIFLVLPTLLLVLFPLLEALGAEVVMDFMSLFFWLFIGLLYLQYAPEPTSLEAKVVGAALVAVLAMTHLALAPINTLVEVRARYLPAPAPHTIDLVPTDAGGYRAEGRKAVFHEAPGTALEMGDDTFVPLAAPFEMRVYGRAFDSLYVFANGIVTFERPAEAKEFVWSDLYLSGGPSIAPLHVDLNPAEGGAVRALVASDSLIVTWDRVPMHADAGGSIPEREMNAQLVLRADGSLQMSLGFMAFRPVTWRRGLSPGGGANESAGVDTRAIAASAGTGNLVSEHLPVTIGPEDMLYREERNLSLQRAWATGQSLKVLGDAFIALLLVIVVVPLFYRSSVRRRLNRLMLGLERANAGDLSGRIPVTVNDEIGQLSTAYNRMTGALGTARNELESHARQLETRVEERTADLTRTLADLRATQAQLVEQEKLASLGALTAGIAHEIKNPLNFVNNFAEVNAELAEEARDALASGDLEAARQALADLEENAAQIAKHGKRADSIVRAMMQHARGGTSERETIVVNDFLEEYAALAWHGMRARDDRFKAELVRDFAPDAGSLAVMPQELGRVVLNLLNNAFDAVRDTPGARVTLASRRTEAGVEITVADNGPGIPPEIREKIFEPFFTTKPTGEGTGLGLSLSYDIVTKGHGGTMTVTATPQGGAEFRIVLPA